MKRIQSISITNSEFFEDLSIDFSEHLNCLMGGRGTGKTSLMYFVMACLHEDAESDKTIYNILKQNLGGGEIILTLEDEDANVYQITKTFGDEPQPYSMETSEFVSLDKILTAVKCDFYEAGRIEKIGREKEERLQLLDKRIEPDIVAIKRKMLEVQLELDSNAHDIKAFEIRSKSMAEMLEQYSDVDSEFTALKLVQPEGMSATDSQAFEKADRDEKLRAAEKRFLSKSLDFLGELSTSLANEKSQAQEFQSKNRAALKEYLNKTIIEGSFSSYETGFKKIDSGLHSVAEAIAELEDIIGKTLDKLNVLHDSQQAGFVKLKQKFDANRTYVNRYNSLSKRVVARKLLLEEMRELEDKKLGLQTTRSNLIGKLNKLKNAIFDRRLRNVKELNEQFDGIIVITLEYGGNTDDYEQLLRSALKGSGLQYNALVPKIVKQFTPDQFAKIIHEQETEKLKQIESINDARSATILSSLSNSDHIYEIEKLYCDDLPNFKLKVDEGQTEERNYRLTEELSLGQRCTAVLPIIFAISSNPLFIDQPEDNLDNKFITNEIHEIIRSQKENRQLVFITHNPNIPVLSDAESNVFLSYDKTARVASNGDIAEVKNQIVRILEGGKNAFLKRKEIYGY